MLNRIRSFYENPTLFRQPDHGYLLKQNEAGVSVAEPCREHGISQAPLHKWRGKYGSMDVAPIKRLKELDGDNAVIGDWLLRLTQTHKRWGFVLCIYAIPKVIFGAIDACAALMWLALNIRIKPKHRIQSDKPDALSVPTAPDQVWSMGFMFDNLASGRRIFNVIGDYNREGLAVDVDFSLPSASVIRAL